MSASVATSLFWIVLAAALAPLIAGSIRGRLVPEVVLLLVAGIVIGPFALDLASAGDEIEMLRELGLGMLFLLAGYEVDKRELTGRGGRRAALTWVFCLGLAFVVTALLTKFLGVSAGTAVAIALTSTALGTLLPILKDRGMVELPIGKAVLNHGAIGEIGPVIAMAVLLGTRGTGLSLALLAVFAGIAVVFAVLPARILGEGTRLLRLVKRGSETTGQTTVRLVMLLLVALIAVAAAFDLDVILGAFAAGFILRRIIPEGDDRLEMKLDGLGFGLLIPVFFVTSGMAIDVSAVGSRPVELFAFLGMLMAVRFAPVLFASRLDREDGFSWRESTQVALYATTGLPIIVAVTGVAVAAGQMSVASASVLVAAGAITVLVLPMLASLLGRTPAPGGKAPVPDARKAGLDEPAEA